MIEFLFAVSDAHGVFDFLPYFCMSYKTTKKDLLIVLGDAGINYFGGSRDTELKKSICRNEITLFCIRGNHEMRPSDVQGMVEIDYCGARAYIEYEYPNIIYAKDGEIYNINGRRFLTIGGAYSVDKWYRIEMGRGWFPNEQLSKDERARILEKISGQKVDFILTHTCPLQFQPTDLFIGGIDQSTVDKKNESKKIDSITYKDPTIFESNGFSWDKQINNIELFFTQINSYKSSLERNLKTIEKELCDIYHAIEFAEKANGVQGFNLFKLERTKLKERRHIKDELMRIDIIQDSSLDDIHNRKISKRLAGIETRTYAPRVLPELFTEKYIVM